MRGRITVTSNSMDENQQHDADIALQQTQEELARIKAEVGDLADGKNVLDRETEEALVNIAGLKQKMADCQLILDEMDTTKATKSSEIAQLQETTETLSVQKTTLSDEIVALRGQHNTEQATAKRASEKALAIATETLKNISADITQATATREGIEKQIEQCQNNLADTEKALAQENNAWSERKAEISCLDEDIQAYTQTLTKVAEEVRQQDVLLLSKQAEKDALNAEIDKNSSKNADLIAKNNTLETELATVLAQIEVAKADLHNVNQRAFAVTRREKDLAQKEEYVQGLYKEAGVPYVPYSDQ